VKISHIFSSDLQRAFRTAEAIREAQSPTPPEITKLQLLREQDFGFYEGKKFFERPRDENQSGKQAHLEAHRGDPGFVEVESKESMRIRVETFIDAHLVQLMHELEEKSVVVVAHGIILSHLWRAILKRFHPFVTVAPSVQLAERGYSLEYLGGWGNTGYMDLEVKRRPDVLSRNAASSTNVETPSEIPAVSQNSAIPDPVLPDGSASENSTSLEPSASSSALQSPANISPSSVDPALVPPLLPRGLNEFSLVVKVVNGQEHLKGLKKTRGGIGSLKHDSNQKTVDSFFKKRRLEPNP
jgi:hypothetical protein